MSTKYKVVLVEIILEIIMVFSTIYFFKHNIFFNGLGLLLIADFVLFGIIFVTIILMDDDNNGNIPWWYGGC